MRIFTIIMIAILSTACSGAATQSSSRGQDVEATRSAAAEPSDTIVATCDYLDNVQELVNDATTSSDNRTPDEAERDYRNLATSLEVLDVPPESEADHASFVSDADIAAERSADVEQAMEEARDEARLEAEQQGLTQAETLARIASAPGYAAIPAWSRVFDVTDGLVDNIDTARQEADCGP